jgi:hypothetical protein
MESTYNESWRIEWFEKSDQGEAESVREEFAPSQDEAEDVAREYITERQGSGEEWLQGLFIPGRLLQWNNQERTKAVFITQFVPLEIPILLEDAYHTA